MRDAPLPKLTKSADGKYHGNYRSEDFRVWKEERSDGSLQRTDWIAASAGLAVIDVDRHGFAVRHHATRGSAVWAFCREVDMAAVQVPEIDQLLARWAAEIKALIPQLHERDTEAMRQLSRSGLPD